MEKQKVQINVTPVRSVVHKNFSDLVAIRGHQNYYVNNLSGKITYKKGKLKIATGLDKIMAAREYVDTVLASLATGSSKEEIKRKKSGALHQSLSSIWDELMVLKKSESSLPTLKTYNSNWVYGIAPFWSKKNTSDINPKTLSEYKIWYLETHPTRHFDKTFIHFNMLLAFAIERGYLQKKPSNMAHLKELGELIRRAVKYERPGRVATPKELSALMAATELVSLRKFGGNTIKHRSLLSCRAKLIILLGATMGLRKMEAGSLLWKRIDFKKKQIAVWSSKNNKWRDIPANDQVLEALKEQHKFTASSIYVFPMPTNKERHLSSQVLDKVWVLTKKLAGIETRLRFHDLRHTFATKTAEDNWPPRIACQVLDMSLDLYGKRYTHPSNTKIAEFMDRSFNSKEEKRAKK